MESRKSSNKISDIVRLQQMLKKWKKLANAPKPPPNYNNNSSSSRTNVNCTTATTTTATTTTATSITCSSPSSSNNNGTTASKGIRFLKRTLSFTDVSSSSSDAVPPKGFLAVCVGRRELKRFVIPTEYLRHHAFEVLLQEAEEEFGFQQEGVLKIPCEVSVFEKILKAVQDKRDVFFFNNNDYDSTTTTDKDNAAAAAGGYCSPDCELTPTHHPQMCR